MCIFTSVLLLQDRHGQLVHILVFDMLNYIDTGPAGILCTPNRDRRLAV